MLKKLVFLMLSLALAGMAQHSLKVCLSAGGLGLAGERPVVSGMYWNGTMWISTPIFVEGDVVNAVYIWDLNKTNPSIHRVMLLPPVFSNLTKICMYLPRLRVRQRPGPPGHPGVMARVRVEAGDEYYIFIATDIPGAVPMNLTAEMVNAEVLEVVRNGKGGGPRQVAGAVAQVAVSLPDSTLQYTSSRDWSLSWQGTIGGAFKLKNTDMTRLDYMTKRCGSGNVEVPPGVPRIDVVITAASTKTTWYVYVTDDTGTHQYVAPLPDGAPYAVVSHYFQSTQSPRTIAVAVCPMDIDTIKTAAIDAFIYLEGAVSMYPTLWHNIIMGGIGGQVYRRGVYVIVPGVHIPPGSVINPLLRADITVGYSGMVYPSTVNIYLGSTPVATVTGTDLGGVVRYSVATTFDAREHLRTGGVADSLIIGPVDGYYMFIENIGVEGTARPEINRPMSRIFRDAATPWLQATYVYIPYGGVANLYMYRADIRIVDRAGSIQLDGVRLVGVLSPWQNYLVCTSDSGNPALRLYLDLYRGWDGSLIRDWDVGQASIQTQGSSEPQLIFFKLVVELLIRLFEAAGWIANALGEWFGWVMFAADLYSSVSSASSVSWYKTSAGDLVIQLYVNYQDAGKPVAFGVNFYCPLSSLGGYDDYVVVVKRVEMCGKVLYDKGMSSIGGAEYYMPKSYIYNYATAGIDLYRTFTCGAQEDLTSGGNAYSCNIDKYR
ncbi:hypothetical protein [Pyrobaculum ferrireducens]|uniref:Uncharacterized protein n=1 Tax=Pyrobaculum ferrireducens TaxID=1104324 RepID=G7VEK2_9CREN|nr:hypothetical protein [Pyrobaculum ferrireducens]AET31626.1 hypothetical protein P186_0165 [Pyrobaculum ferrireducens]